MAGLDCGNWGLRGGNWEHMCIDFFSESIGNLLIFVELYHDHRFFSRVTFGASGDCPHSILFNLIIVILFPSFSVSVAGDCRPGASISSDRKSPFQYSWRVK